MPQPQQAQRRILIVDDEAAIREIEIRSLAAQGFECLAAGSAAEALNVLETADVDIVLTDITMPGENGIGLARVVHERHPDIVVIMVTASSDRNTVTDARLAGASDYIVKPFRSDELLAAATRGLNLRARRKRASAVNTLAGAASTTPSPQSVAGTRLDQLLRRAVYARASDLHLSSGSAAMIRVDGTLAILDRGGGALSGREIMDMIQPVLPLDHGEFGARRDADFAFEIDGLGRFRCNVFTQRAGPAAAFRVIPAVVPSVAALDLPVSVTGMCDISEGLVLFTGPTGSGKTTTIASLIDHIAARHAGHIITVEDPIEYVYSASPGLVHQREIGTHAPSFPAALRSALREDPDVLFIGEIRDAETMAITLHAAETGHLVFATLHAATAAAAIDRVIDQFPAEQQQQVRVSLAHSLKGVVAHAMCQRAGGGRIVAREILRITPAVANLIRAGRTFQVLSLMQVGRGAGMTPFAVSLADLVRRGAITQAEAELHVRDTSALRARLA